MCNCNEPAGERVAVEARTRVRFSIRINDLAILYPPNPQAPEPRSYQ